MRARRLWRSRYSSAGNRRNDACMPATSRERASIDGVRRVAHLIEYLHTKGIGDTRKGRQMGKWRIVIAVALVAAGVGAVWSFQPRAASILVSDAVVQAMEMNGHTVAMITMSIDNQGGPDRLVGLAAADGQASLMGVTDPRGAPIPANSTTSLASDGAHGVLMVIDGPIEDGRLMALTLAFESAGETPVKAVLRSSDADPEDNLHAMHGSATIEAGGAAAPSLAMGLQEVGDGWRLGLDLTNFRLAPENVDGPHRPGEGHGHLYIGGMKIMRVTQPSVEIGALPRGRHTVTVALYSNDHRRLTLNGQPLEVSAEIEAR